MTNLIVGAFTLCYFAVTLFLCRGMRLSARDICLAGLMSAATLVLRCFLITLPNGSHISLGAMLPILLLFPSGQRQGGLLRRVGHRPAGYASAA